MSTPGSGGLQDPPLNLPGAQLLIPGVQAGVSSGLISASRVVISGPGGLLLVYSPSVGFGNLILSVAGAAGTDSAGNAYPAGLAIYRGTVSSRLRGKYINDGSNTSTSIVPTFTPVTASFPIPAGEPRADSEYVLRTWGQGNWGPGAPGAGAYFEAQGNFTGGSGIGTVSIDASQFPINTAFKWYMETHLIVTTPGAAGSWISYTLLSVALSAAVGDIASPNAVTGISTSSGVINTTVAFNMWIEAAWGSSGSATVTSNASSFEPTGS